MKPSQQILINVLPHQVSGTKASGKQAHDIKAAFEFEEIMISYNTYLINVRKVA